MPRTPSTGSGSRPPPESQAPPRAKPTDAPTADRAGRGEASDLGHAVPASATLSGLAHRMALDPAQLAVRDRPPAGLYGAALGDEIALSPEARGDDLLGRIVAAHELAHVRDRGHGSEVDRERRADRIAIDALLGRTPREALGGVIPPLRLRGCDKKPSAADQARTALDQFGGMSAADQEAFVAKHYTSGSYAGTIRTHLEALPVEERTGKYRETIRKLLQVVERQEVRASTGMTDAQMATKQAKFMDAEALAAAQAATGSATPTADEKSAAHTKSVKELSLPARATNRWDALPVPPDPAQDDFRKRAGEAVAKIVKRGAVVAPELKITDAHLHFSPETIDRAADTRYAEYDRGNNRLNFGMDFTDAAMKDPDFVMGVVVHEIFGHGEYGGIGDSYPLALYKQARPQATGALTDAQRAAPITSEEKFGFGYQGTEIYSELREAQYDVRAPAGSGIMQGDKPKNDILKRVGLIKEKFEGTVARGVLRGMYARFALDPRITPAALKLFVDAVDTHFPGEKLLAPRP